MRTLWTGLLERLRRRGASAPPERPAPIDPAFEALIAPLPPVARDEFARRAVHGGPLPQNAASLFEAVHDWAIGAGIAEGRGGYPGGRGKPDWSDYVRLQRKHVAIFHALEEVFGQPSLSLAKTFRDYERSFPPLVRRMGDGYEPHVDDVAGRLVYSLPVDSGFVGLSFSFPIIERDLDVLLADPYRRAVLEVVAHVVLQHSMLRGNPEVTELDFRQLLDAVLHSAASDLERTIATVDRTHHTSIAVFVEAALRRRSDAANPSEGKTPCAS